MKSLINIQAAGMMLMLMFLPGTSAWADVDDYLLSVRNVSHTTNSIDFDLYLLDADNTQPFEFAALQMGLLLNSSIYGAGTLTVSYSNTGSGLAIDQQFAGSADIVGTLPGYPDQTLIRLAANLIPPVPPGAGSGTVISSTGDGTLLAHFTITSSASFTPNSTPNLAFCASTAVSPLYPTVLSTYINGDAVPLTVIPGIDAVVYGNPLLNATLPAVFSVTGTGTYCQDGDGLVVGLNGSEADATYTLYMDGAEATTIPGTGSAISFGLQTEGTYTVTATNAAGDEDMNGQAVITETAIPAAAGTISGPASFTPGTSGIAYSVSPISAATSYNWNYTGSGVTIIGSGATVTLDFSPEAIAGTLSVYGSNSCGDGVAATLALSPSIKTLTLTSVLLEGLYVGAGTMRQAIGESGPVWPAGIADHISVELHSSSSYATIIYTATEVELTTSGTASVTVPAEHTGSYYITVKHRNSVETTTAIAVSFLGTTVNYSFNLQSSAYGGNLGSSGDGRFLIFSGDVNQDGLVDTQDYLGVDNDAYNYLSGYLVTDVDGNGTVDTNDYLFIDNNNYNYVGTIHP